MSRRRVDIATGTRADRRALAREQARAKVQNLRDWHRTRAEAAEKRRRARRARHDDANAKQAVDDLSRGINRVPARLQGLTVTETPVLYGKRDTERERPLAQPGDLHPAGNYATRRARGQRGKERPLRTRELSGAVQRRLVRAQKEWLQA